MLIANGRMEDAARHLEDLLELDPQDRLEMRNGLLGIVLALSRLDRARELIAEGEQEGSDVARWGRVLERWLSGDRRGAARLLRELRDENALVEQELLEPGSVEPEVAFLADDVDEDEPEPALSAAVIGVCLGRAWEAHPEAIDWLRAEGPESTEDERRERVASFAPPVSNLFALGRIQHSAEWIDYAARCGFGEDHVAELIRMAIDPALHELDADPQASAPQHAWRALATLRAEDAIEPLLAYILEYPDDDDLLNDLPRVLSRIGPAALAKIFSWMRAHDANDFVRCVAYEAISGIVGQDALLRRRALQALGAELDRCIERDREINGWLVAALLDLHAVELAPQIQNAFEEDWVDPSIVGDWEAVKEELGVGENA